MDFKKEISNAMGGGAGGDKDNKDNKSGGGDDAKQYVDKGETAHIPTVGDCSRAG